MAVIEELKDGEKEESPANRTTILDGKGPKPKPNPNPRTLNLKPKTQILTLNLIT